MRQYGFCISVSLVALFTAGSEPLNGFRIGGGITLSQTINNWTFLTGLDAYKARQKFGLGTSFAGILYNDRDYGASYYLNKYYQGDKQISGIFSLHLNDFQIHFEDDILAYPFTGFKVYDRYRSAAMEIRYKRFIIGTHVYTTDIDGMTDVSPDNSKGRYVTGKQLSSPVYLGYMANYPSFTNNPCEEKAEFFPMNTKRDSTECFLLRKKFLCLAKVILKSIKI